MLMLVGNRLGAAFRFPPPTHFPPGGPGPAWRTVRDAIGHLPPPSPPSEAALRTAGTIKRRIETHGY